MIIPSGTATVRRSGRFSSTDCATLSSLVQSYTGFGSRGRLMLLVQSRESFDSDVHANYVAPAQACGLSDLSSSVDPRGQFCRAACCAYS